MKWSFRIKKLSGGIYGGEESPDTYCVERTCTKGVLWNADPQLNEYVSLDEAIARMDQLREEHIDYDRGHEQIVYSDI